MSKHAIKNSAKHMYVEKKQRKKITDGGSTYILCIMQTEMQPDVTEEIDQKTEQPKKRKRRSEGRPHKRLPEPLLFKRKEDVRRKLEIHKAKCILLKERLELYEREVSFRTQPEVTAS